MRDHDSLLAAIFMPCGLKLRKFKMFYFENDGFCMPVNLEQDILRY